MDVRPDYVIISDRDGGLNDAFTFTRCCPSSKACDAAVLPFEFRLSSPVCLLLN